MASAHIGWLTVDAEADPEDTIVPRLMANGADLARVHILRAVKMKAGRERMLNLQTDLEALEAKIDEVGDVVLAIIDPITSYTGDVDENSNAKNRVAVLDPLSALAGRLDIAICTITHFRKEGDGKATRKAAHRVHGSIANLAAPRLNFAVISDPENRERRMLLETKVNITKPQMGLAYALEEIGVAEGINVPRVIWEDQPIDITADQALALFAEGEGEGRGKQQVADLILRVLESAGTMTANEIQNELTDMNYNTICGTLRRMLKAGRVGQDGKKYFLPASAHVIERL